MTATGLQNIARRVSNQSWCRYWLNYGDKHKPVTMAIQCRDANGKPEAVPDLLKLGFTEHFGRFYTITRTNEDGSEFESKLF